MLTLDAAPFKPPDIIATAVRENRRKWSRIIAEIKAGYKTQYGRSLSNWKLGEMVGLDHTSIEHLDTHDKAQPRHYEGELLLALHREYSAHPSGTPPGVDAPDVSK